jgi:hypothetical protein
MMLWSRQVCEEHKTTTQPSGKWFLVDLGMKCDVCQKSAKWLCLKETEIPEQEQEYAAA